MNFRNLAFLLALIFGFAACGEKTPNQKTKKLTDTNGYVYETVEGDIFKARIYTLKNGLKVYLSQNTATPKIYTFIGVRAGSKNDPKGTTGLAHYFEHIMFKGTDQIGTANWQEESKFIKQISDLFEAHKAETNPEKKKAIYAQIDSVSNIAAKFAVANEYDKIVANIGALQTNAFTANDMTAYVNEIPANEIDRWLTIERERFQDPVLRLFHTELETVYEEYNMGQDNDMRFAYYTILKKLFPSHPYGIPVIGTPEDLKNPSMVNINKFKDKYYVANNMAIMMMGDLEYDKTIQLIDQKWGDFKTNPELSQETFIEETEPVKAGEYEILSPDKEFVAIAYRAPRSNTHESRLLKMIDMILSNSQAGLIDLNLIKKQKVNRAFSSYSGMNDYGLFYMFGYPMQGQKLEETNTLLMQQIDKIKKGEFEDWLLNAIINDMKLSQLQYSETNYGVYDFLDAFIGNYPWEDQVTMLDKMAKISKDEIVQYANSFFTDNNKVVIYKRTGENKNKVKVDKPHITPFEVNRDAQSEFYTKLDAQKPQAFTPQFLNFDQQIQHDQITAGVPFFYTKNTENSRAYLMYILEMGRLNDKKMALAFNYLNYLGTEKLSAEDLSKEFYKIGISKRITTQDERSYVMISGLDENLEQGINLVEQMLSSAVADKEVYLKYVDKVLKNRQNAKLDKNSILWSRMYDYGQYGADNPSKAILTEEQLKAIDPQELVDIIKKAFTHEHLVYYYGPRNQADAKALVKKQHTLPQNMAKVTEPKQFDEQNFDNPEVYFCNYDMVQAQIILLAKDVPFNPELLPLARLFNEYYGGSMGSIIFQEMREARGLAYTAFAGYDNAAKANENNFMFGFIGTQPDKVGIALDKFNELLNEMPLSENAFQAAKKNIITNINSERIIRDDIFWTFLNNKDRGLSIDVRKDIYEKVQNYSQQDLQLFFNEHVKGKNFKVLILANKNDVDFNVLKKYGQVKELTLDELFGY